MFPCQTFHALVDPTACQQVQFLLTSSYSDVHCYTIGLFDTINITSMRRRSHLQHIRYTHTTHLNHPFTKKHISHNIQQSTLSMVKPENQLLLFSTPYS